MLKKDKEIKKIVRNSYSILLLGLLMIAMMNIVFILGIKIITTTFINVLIFKNFFISLVVLVVLVILWGIANYKSIKYVKKLKYGYITNAYSKLADKYVLPVYRIKS